MAEIYGIFPRPAERRPQLAGTELASRNEVRDAYFG
jgi:hypothetical protein